MIYTRPTFSDMESVNPDVGEILNGRKRQQVAVILDANER